VSDLFCMIAAPPLLRLSSKVYRMGVAFATPVWGSVPQPHYELTGINASVPPSGERSPVGLLKLPAEVMVASDHVGVSPGDLPISVCGGEKRFGEGHVGGGAVFF